MIQKRMEAMKSQYENKLQVRALLKELEMFKMREFKKSQSEKKLQVSSKRS
jgi:hypothetical protein